MRLTDLKPKWMRRDGNAVGLIFLCPDCVRGRCKEKKSIWLTVVFAALNNREQRELIERTLAEHPEEFAGVGTGDVVSCTEGRLWKRTSKLLETISITPSIDASASGHWHGSVGSGVIDSTEAPVVPAPAGGLRCYFLSPVEPKRVKRFLRVYAGVDDDEKCPLHDARLWLGEYDAEDRMAKPDDSDPRWPANCKKCGKPFTEAAHRMVDDAQLFRRSDNGALETLGEAKPGAMWFAPWYSDSAEFRGPDGKTLVVRLPDGHDWIVDSRAANCSKRQDKVHKCWVRHGEAPNITVDKQGNTCAAGGVSIATPKWHGFLRDGYLVRA